MVRRTGRACSAMAWPWRRKRRLARMWLLCSRCFTTPAGTMNDNHDPEHGARGATLARILHGQQFQLDDSGLALLLVACETHTTGTRHPAVTVRTCWDADRLDMWRVGIRPHPSRLATEAGRQPQLLLEAIERSVGMNFPGATPSF